MEKTEPPWIKRIELALTKEKDSQRSRWIQLATISLDNKPRVRTVVFRGWNKQSQMEILSDTRSEKVSEIAQNPNIEICWMFPRSKSQFRIRGKAIFDQGVRANSFWLKLSPEVRSLWAWPAPGKQLKDDSFSLKETPDGVAMPTNFLLIKINIHQTEELQLNEYPHRRTTWSKNNNWIEELTTP